MAHILGLNSGSILYGHLTLHLHDCRECLKFYKGVRITCSFTDYIRRQLILVMGALEVSCRGYPNAPRNRIMVINIYLV